MPDRAINSLEAWRTRITESETFMQAWYSWWDAALEKIQPKLTDDPKRRHETIDCGRGFTLVEQKTPQLFYQAPELILKPSPLMEAGYPNPQNPQQMIPLTGVLQTHQDILNEKLGPDGVDAVRLWKRLIRDQVGVSGVGVAVMGYEQTAIAVEPPQQPGAILGLSQPVAVPIYSHCFWERLSPKKLLIPAGTTEPDCDKWPWVGYKWVMEVQKAIPQFKLKEDFRGKTTRDEAVLDHGLPQSSTADLVEGVTIWYQAYLFDPDVKHPLIRRTLTIIEGLDEFAEPPSMKYQTQDPQGQLTPDSLLGYPVIVQVPRDVPDLPIPQSDIAVAIPVMNELNRFRDQMVRQRDSNIPLRGANVTALGPDLIGKIESGQIGSIIPFDGPINDDDFKELSKTSYARENYTSNDYLDSDLARITALDANQSGAQSDTGKTATEAQLMQGATNVRLDDERGRQLAGYVKAVTKYSTLVQRYVTVEQAAKIVGVAKAQQWQQVMKLLPASLAFTAKPDSAIRADASSDRKKALDWLNFSAQSPFVNQMENWKQAAKWYGLNADLLVTQPQEKKEPPKASMALKPEDFVGPAAPIAQAFAQAAGIQITPEMMQAVGMFAAMWAQMQAQQAMQQQAAQGQPQHGGAAPKVDLISKHSADETGGMQNTGQPAPIAPGGQVM